jgi:hypothetical protein
LELKKVDNILRESLPFIEHVQFSPLTVYVEEGKADGDFRFC